MAPTAQITKSTAKTCRTVDAVGRRASRVTIPVVQPTVDVPTQLIPDYIGVGAMAAIELIDWPVALVIAAGIPSWAVAAPALRELAGGVEAGG